MVEAATGPGDILADVIVAHQGGWDEIALVAAPIVIIALLLLLANHRAGKKPPE